jgi:hypothetical protein
VSLPPEADGAALESQLSTAVGAGNGVAETAFTPGQMGTAEFPGVATSRMAYTSLARLMFTTGIVVCLILSLIFFIDGNPLLLGVFGFLSIVFFLLLLRTPRKRVALSNTWWNGRVAEPEITNPTNGPDGSS